MGNNPPQNQRFNPNFNMAEYNRKLNQISHQYNNQNLSAPGAFYSTQAKTENMSCQQITRNVYIYKTNIEIHIDNKQINLQFDYHSPNACFWDLAVGVRRIQQNQATKQTTHVDCMKNLREALQPGEKVKFNKTYPLQGNEASQILNLGIMMKISNEGEASQYSLIYNKNLKLWKVVVQNFTKGNQIFGIQDIYGGGGESDQECIICLSQKSNTMVKPCNHVCLCADCAKMMQTQTSNCPICRKKILSLITLTSQK